MATKKAAQTGAQDNTQSTAAVDNAGTGAVSKDPQDTGVQLSDDEKAELQKVLDELEAKKKEIKAKIKGKPAPKPKKEAKGIMVSFKNQKGEDIVGLGNLYYVVRGQDKKLHYKAQDAVHILTAEEIAAIAPAATATAAPAGEDITDLA